MKRIENHINKLFEQLPNTEEVSETKLELLNDSREKYEDLINKGMSSFEAEQTVIDDLGNVDDWKKEFVSEEESNLIETPKKNNTVRNIVLIVAAIIIIPSLIIGAIAMNSSIFVAKNPESETGSNNEGKNNTQENNNSQKENIEDPYHKTINDINAIQKLKVDAVAYDIIINVVENADEISVSLDSSIDDEILIETKKDELKIKSKKEMDKNLRNYSGTFVIEIPSQFINDIEVDSVSGDVDIDGINSTVLYDEISIETVSGNVRVFHLNVIELDLESVSGDNELTNVTISNELSIDNVSGDTKILVATSHPRFEVKKESVSGKYNDERSNTGEGIVKVSFESVSGNLTISDYIE